MRRLLLAFAVTALAACDSGGVPPPGQEPLRASTPQVAQDEVKLRADGVVAGSESFYFAAGQNEVTTALARVLGDATNIANNDECGVGPMTVVRFPGGLTVNFQRGSLVGWLQSEPNANVTAVGDLQVGMDKASAAEAKGFAPVKDSTLGEEFSLGQLGGFIEGDAVTMLYAGKQCFFR